jgi:hypothetical protein
MAQTERPDDTTPTRDRHAAGGEYDHDAVRRRAYELYQSRGGAGGGELDDWLTAEHEVRIRRESDGGAPSAAAELGRDAREDTSGAAFAASGSSDVAGYTGTTSEGLADVASDPLAAGAGNAPGAVEDATEGMASTARPRTRRGKRS